MHKEKLLTKKQMESLITREDNSSTRITVKISEDTKEKINFLLKTSPNFKSLFKKVIEGTLEILPINDDGKKRSAKSKPKTQKEQQQQRVLIQKTFVITNNQNRILSSMASHLSFNKSLTFELLFLIYSEDTIKYKEKLAMVNLPIYEKTDKLLDELTSHFYEFYKKIFALYEQHDPPLSELDIDLRSDDPIERFLCYLQYSEIHLSDTWSELQEAIDECKKIISLSDGITKEKNHENI